MALRPRPRCTMRLDHHCTSTLKLRFVAFRLLNKFTTINRTSEIWNLDAILSQTFHINQNCSRISCSISEA